MTQKTINSTITTKNVALEKIEGFIYKIEYDFISKLISYYFPKKESLNILEIGSYKGKSTLMFLNAHPSVRITCIEPFFGIPKDEAEHLYGEEYKSVFLKNTDAFRNRITLIEKYSNDSSVIQDLNGENFDICFIDGDHSYDVVKNDIDLSLSHLKDDGLIILDDYWINCDPDYKHCGVKDATNEKLLYNYKLLCVIRSMIVFQKNTNYKNYEL
jgi:predicted O-methyltransferase YrrM